MGAAVASPRAAASPASLELPASAAADQEVLQKQREATLGKQAGRHQGQEGQSQEQKQEEGQDGQEEQEEQEEEDVREERRRVNQLWAAMTATEAATATATTPTPAATVSPTTATTPLPTGFASSRDGGWVWSKLRGATTAAAAAATAGTAAAAAAPGGGVPGVAERRLGAEEVAGGGAPALLLRNVSKVFPGRGVSPHAGTHPAAGLGYNLPPSSFTWTHLCPCLCTPAASSPCRPLLAPTSLPAPSPPPYPHHPNLPSPPPPPPRLLALLHWVRLVSTTHLPTTSHHLPFHQVLTAAPHVAVCGLSLAVGGRETLGLLGPNGAGKTTTLRIMQGGAGRQGRSGGGRRVGKGRSNRGTAGWVGGAFLRANRET